MKKSVLLLFCLGVVVSLIATGCAGQGTTASENNRKTHRVLETGQKQLADDLSRTVFHSDRPSRNTIMYNR